MTYSGLLFGLWKKRHTGAAAMQSCVQRGGGHLLGNRRGEFCRNAAMSVPVTQPGPALQAKCGSVATWGGGESAVGPHVQLELRL